MQRKLKREEFVMSSSHKNRGYGFDLGCQIRFVCQRALFKLEAEMEQLIKGERDNHCRQEGPLCAKVSGREEHVLFEDLKESH